MCNLGDDKRHRTKREQHFELAQLHSGSELGITENEYRGTGIGNREGETLY